MASLRFELKSKKEPSKTTPIYLVVSDKGLPVLKYPTGIIEVTPSQWNDSTKRVRNKDGVNYYELNKRLDFLDTNVTDYFAKLLSENKAVDKEELKAFLDELTNKNSAKKTEIKEKSNVLGFINAYLEILPNKINPKSGTKVCKQTVSKFKVLYSLIEEMKGSEKLLFKDIDIDFYERFTALMRSKQYRPNTIGKYVEALKTMIGRAKRAKVAINEAYDPKEFYKPSEETLKVYLNKSEIERLERLDLSSNLRLEKVRDVFLLGCYTGQRYDDYSRFNKLQISEVTGKTTYKEIVIRQPKTQNDVKIPISKKFIEIMEKYDYVIPRISNVNFNDYLKEVCQLAGFSDKVSRTINKGGTLVTEQFEKWQLIGTHTARRSFATNAYKENRFTIRQIMLYTGHRKESEFLKYLCLSDDEANEMMLSYIEGTNKSPLNIVNY